MDTATEIKTLIRAKYPILYLCSWEEQRVEQVVKGVCDELGRTFHSWSVIQGFKPAVKRTSGPAEPKGLGAELEALATIHEAAEGAVFILKDFHYYIKDYRVVRLLRDAIHKLRQKKQTIVLLSPVLTLPVELEKDISVVDFSLPNRDEVEGILDRILEGVADKQGIDAKLSGNERELIIKSSIGLTRDEIENVLARSLVESRKFDVEVILDEKKQIVRKSGLLEYYPAENRMSDVGGMELLKDWLAHRTESFTDRARDFGIPNPKGILILGVQGCGKSLLAKAVAAHWSLPMLKMDVGRIFGSLVGQSEENMRRAIKVAESVAPCILWMDELEKGFAGVSGGGVSDSGTTARVFATFLTWMQEKTKPVFLIATANDVSKLPPEMLRKGRFDEIFFVDLPDKSEREQIFGIHLSKRKRDPKKFDLKALAENSFGYSGAELEQVVIGALYRAFNAKRELSQEDLMVEVDSIVPLSVMMREEIAELREWASLRTRPASKSDGD